MSIKSGADGLERFVVAQALCYGAVLAELRAGRKTSHWMWFVFPQLVQLGRSETARLYGLADAAEARAYALHPLLGPRLEECANAVLATSGRTANQIFGSPDDLKLCSSMTLFERAWPESTVFAAVLDRFYEGRRDPMTLQLLDGPTRG
ncbi:MAG: calpastatin [Variovorax sp.]|nr:calpastatin [Variovorax sp.]